MSEITPENTPTMGRTFDHLRALMILDEIEESVIGVSADLREFRVRIAHLGLMDKDLINIAE